MNVNLQYTIIIFILVVSPVLLLGLALLLIFIPLLASFPISGSNARNSMAAIVTGILELAWLVALCIYLIKTTIMAGRVFETSFTSRGFLSSNFWDGGGNFKASEKTN